MVSNSGPARPRAAGLILLWEGRPECTTHAQAHSQGLGWWRVASGSISAPTPYLILTFKNPVGFFLTQFQMSKEVGLIT